MVVRRGEQDHAIHHEAGRAGAALCTVAAGRSTTAPAQADGAFGTDRNCCDHGALSQVPSTSKRNLLGSDAGAAPGGPARQQDGKRQRLALQADADAGLSGAEQRALPHLHHPGGDHRAAAALRGRRLSAAERTWTPVALHREQTSRRRPGETGTLSTDTVLKVQQRLHDHGFRVRDNIDGQWGPRFVPSRRITSITAAAAACSQRWAEGSGTSPSVVLPSGCRERP